MLGPTAVTSYRRPQDSALQEPTPQRILKLCSESSYDFRRTAFEGDSLRSRFPEWVKHYRLKWAIARTLQPASILEIGVRYGYSAAAFLDACPDAEYLGIDIDSDEFDGAKDAIHWAAKITAGCKARYLVADSQKMTQFPGTYYDLIHVDGRHDGDGSFHDLQLAMQQGRFVLADGYFWTPQSFRSISDFLFAFRDLLEYYWVIPGYAGELLIKSRLDPKSSTMAAVQSSEDLRHTYSGDYYLNDCGGYNEYKRTGGKELQDLRLVAVAALATLRPHGRVLDLGCGRGELAYHFAREGRQVTAIDYSPEAVRLTEQTFQGDPDLRSRAEVLQANIVEWRPSGKYDVATASDVVEHLTPAELDVVYASVANHLTPDGIFIVHTYPNLWCLKYEYARKRRIAASVGAYLPGEPRSRYELLMHINEQSPRVLKRQLSRHFPHVLLWFGEPGNEGGSLLRDFRHREMASAPDLWAIASLAVIDVAEVRRSVSNEPLPVADLLGVRLAVVSSPAEIQTSHEFRLRLQIVNQGPCILGSLPPLPVHIGYHWLPEEADGEQIFDGLRSPIRPPISPGGMRDFPVKVMPPSIAGRYTLRVTLVQELVRWFDAEPVSAFTDISFEVKPG
jgi:2-polyprenyl-3-methyl-5-hydroxy-6-metoxy-1,4-benzoquinol methylase